MLDRKHLLLGLLFFTLHPITAQNKVDSLLQVLSEEKVDSSKVKLYGQLGGLYRLSVPDTAIYYYNKGLEISKKNKHKRNIARNFISLGSVYKTKSQYDKALNYYQQALDIYKTIDYKKDVATLIGNMGIVYKRKGDIDKAMEYYLKALKINEEINNDTGKANNYNNIGLLYYNKGQYDKAIEYYQKKLRIIEQTKDEHFMASTYVNIAIVFMDQGDNDKAISYYQKAITILKKLKSYNTLGICYVNTAMAYNSKLELEKSIEYSDKALKMLTKVGNNYAISYVYDNLGSVYSAKENFQKAKEYYLKSLAIAEKIGDKLGVSAKSNLIASNYNVLKEYSKAISYAKTSVRIAKELGSIREQRAGYKELSTAYAGKNNYKKAFEYKLLETKAKDSLFTIEKTEKINDIQTKYETEKKDLEITNKALEIDGLEKKAQRNKIVVLASGLILGLGILALAMFYRHRLTKEKYKAEMFNQKLLRSQMNPHFIFNTLTSIQSYMFEKDTKKAAMYLSSFSKLTRSILEGSRHDFVSLQEDYETNESYLKIQQMRHNNLFDYSISIDENIDPDSVQIAPMLIQPFLENSVKHGFKDIDYKGYLEIIYKKIGSKIEITIADNGKGFTTKKDSTHKSHALSITKERLSILNKRSKDKISFNVENTDDKGYKVVFNVPLKVA